jgi:hypothetical protein
LQHAQEPRLQISRHVGYFVKKQRAAVCRSDHSREIVHRSGERAFDVTEKFSLDHRLRECSAIELHHRFSSASAAGVNRVRNHFLAHAAFACDKNVRIRGRHRRDQFLNLLHRFALKNWGGSRFRDL